MRLRRPSPLALLGAGALLAACTPDNSPDVTAPGGYVLDLETAPANATVPLVDSLRITSVVRNTAIADTALNRVSAIAGGVPILRVRFENAADTAVVRLKTNLNPAVAGRPLTFGAAEVAGQPGVYGFYVFRRTAGTATFIVEFTDTNNGRTLADTVRVTAN